MDNLELSLVDAPSECHCHSTDCCHEQPIVLIVDDNEDNLLLLSCVFESLNCSLITAPDGQTALSIAQTYQPALILLDILLPDLDGVAVISQLRQNPKTQDIPVIAVTALARKEDKQRILEAGGNAYISKPYMIFELEVIVQNFLESRKTF